MPAPSIGMGPTRQSNRELPVDANCLAGITGDMNRAGLRPFWLDALRALAEGPAKPAAAGPGPDA
ncbi:hypothetical protein OG345_39665 [Streptomyces sp. NBC_01220]|uniref:hypothetical protein n=1 Tax=unclassified Streptomyces TaxID=2593676 RepID=UPI002E2A6980|nr:hypothetical protein [Streptomyces sp. NBC_00184]WSQ48675.1 hypothetical protein OG345_39665 [Streptomyces sp. NBC_01220]